MQPMAPQVAPMYLPATVISPEANNDDDDDQFQVEGEYNFTKEEGKLI